MRTHAQNRPKPWFCAGSGVVGKNVKNLLAQPHCDPCKGQHRSTKPESQELSYLYTNTHTYALIQMESGGDAVRRMCQVNLCNRAASLLKAMHLHFYIWFTWLFYNTYIDHVMIRKVGKSQTQGTVSK